MNFQTANTVWHIKTVVPCTQKLLNKLSRDIKLSMHKGVMKQNVMSDQARRHFELQDLLGHASNKQRLRWFCRHKCVHLFKLISFPSMVKNTAAWTKHAAHFFHSGMCINENLSGLLKKELLQIMKKEKDYLPLYVNSSNRCMRYDKAV